MSSATTTLVQTVSFGVASGNYDGASTTWYSVATQAAGYYNYSSGLNTVAYYMDKFFVGNANMQISLATYPGAGDWVDLESTLVGNMNVSSTVPLSAIVNFTGNYVWVRVKISNFSAGSILKIQYNY